MKIYDCTADCLVDFCLLHYYVKAKNMRDAWLKAYVHFNNSPVADGGSVDCKRINYDEVPTDTKIY